MAVEDGNTDVSGKALVLGRNPRRIDVRHVASHSNRADGGARQVSFSVEEFVGGLARGAQRRKFGTIIDGLGHQRRGGGWWRLRKGFVGELKIRRLVRPNGAAQFGERSSHAVLGPQKQKFRLRYVDVGETDIHLGSKFVAGQ